MYDWLITVRRNVTGKSRHMHLHKLLDNIDNKNRYKNGRKKDCFCICECPCTCTHAQEGLHMPVQLITWLIELIKGYTHWMLIQTCCSRSCQPLEAATGTSDRDLITLNMSTGSMVPSNNIYRCIYLPL